MKNILIITFTLLTFISCSSNKQAVGNKKNYIVISDDEEKVLKGYIDKSVLESDTAFKWFHENMKYGNADATAVEAFKTYGKEFEVIVFGGTWCHDTQAMLPVFYRLVEKSGYPENKIKLIAVDRSKIAPDDLQNTYNVTNVPTFIILKDGKEAGRVVEYGKEGKIDKELGEIVLKAVSK